MCKHLWRGVVAFALAMVVTSGVVAYAIDKPIGVEPEHAAITRDVEQQLDVCISRQLDSIKQRLQLHVSL